MDCSLPGSSAHEEGKSTGVARVLEWGTIAFSIRHLQMSNIPYISLLLLMISIRSVLISGVSREESDPN